MKFHPFQQFMFDVPGYQLKEKCNSILLVINKYHKL